MATDPLRLSALEHAFNVHLVDDARTMGRIIGKLDDLAEGQRRIEHIVVGKDGGPGLGEMAREQSSRLDGADQGMLRVGAHLERHDVEIRALQAAPANDALEDRKLIRRTGLGEFVKLAIVGAIGGFSVSVAQPVIAAIKGLFGAHP